MIKRDRVQLWKEWMLPVNQLAGAFGRKKTFFWFVLVLMGFSVKFDAIGVTSVARGVGLLPSCYTSMLNFFVSGAVNLELLRRLWVTVIFRYFGGIVRINNRVLIVGDGIKAPKEGRKMPGVKWLHQSSDSNSKPEFIMGHSIQALCVLAQGLSTCFAVPLTAEIHEGVRFHWRDTRTLLDKMFEMLTGLGIPETYYLVLDRYYASGRFVKQLVSRDIHIVTMMKKNAVAYRAAKPPKKKQRGRPKKYGEKIKLFDLFKTELPFKSAPWPNDERLTIEYYAIKLLWKPFGDLVLFVLTRHPVRGDSIVMSTDLGADPMSLVTVYGFRFRIEVFFRMAVHQVGAFLYRFWLKKMAPRKRGGKGDQNMQFAPKDMKESVCRKLHAYHLFIQAAFIAHGLLQYLSIKCRQSVWSGFGTWLRTIRPNTLPSEMVVSMALSGSHREFLIDGQHCPIFTKFMQEKLDARYFRHKIPTSAEAA